MAQEARTDASNPIEPFTPLKAPAAVQHEQKEANPQNTIFAVDSAVTKAEKIERHGVNDDEFQESPSKRIKINPSPTDEASNDSLTKRERRKGVAPIRKE